MANRTVSVGLIMDVRRYVQPAKQAIKTTRDFRSELAAAAAKGDLDAVASQATKAGLALTGAFAGITLTAASFDKAMSSVSAATLASAADLESLREAALEAGADTAFSASEAAKGIEELAKAGVGTADILGGGLAGALDLAAAGEIEVGQAAEIAASAMTQFKLSGQDVTHVADLLAAGAGKAQGGVADMSQALNQSGLVAAQVGLSIEETTGTLAAFASAGLLGSDAGTSFKTMLQRLIAPTGEAAELMSSLGISAFDARGQFVGMAKLAGQLQQALGGMTAEQRSSTLATLFGTDAIRAASIVYEQGSRGIDGWVRAVDDQGFAADQAGRKLDNLMGDVEELTGSLETLAIESGSGANEGLRILTQAATALVNQFGELPPVISGTAVVLAGVTGVSLLAFAAFIKMRGSAALALAELRAMGPAGSMAATGLQRAARWGGRAVGVFAALQVAGLAVSQVIGRDLNPQVDALGEGLARWSRSGQVSGEAARLLGDDLAKLDTAFRAFNASGFEQGLAGFIETMSFTEGVDDSWHRAQERVAAVDQALAQLVQAGRAEEAAAGFEQLAAMGERHNLSTEEMLRIMPAYAGALETAGAEAGTAADGIEEMGTVAEQAADDVDALRDAFDRLFGIQMDLDRAQSAYARGLADLTAELDDGERSLSLNTQAGLDNRDATLDQIDAIKNVRQANIDNGMAIDEANRQYLDQLDLIADMLIDRGFEEQAVRDLIDTYKQVPGDVTTTVSTPGMEAAEAAAKRLQERLAGIDRTVTISFSTRGFAPSGAIAIPERWGGVLAAQHGRLVPAHTVSSPTVLYGERATGQEAYIPKHGDFGRSMDILRQAASWYGMAITPAQMARQAGRSAGAAAGINVEHQSISVQAWSDRFSYKQVMDEAAMHGAV